MTRKSPDPAEAGTRAYPQAQIVVIEELSELGEQRRKVWMGLFSCRIGHPRLPLPQFGMVGIDTFPHP